MAVSEAGDVVSKGGGLISSIFNFVTNPWVLGAGAVALPLLFGDVSFALNSDSALQVGADVASTGGEGVNVPVGGAEALNFATSIVGQWLEWAQAGISGLDELVNS